MRSRLLLAVALAAVLPQGCHEDDTVVTVFVVSPGDPLTILTCGGNASATDGSNNGTGGTGGAITLSPFETAIVGGGTILPVAPSAPTAPTGTELTIANVAADYAVAGNLQVTSTLTITGVPTTRTITALTGDIIVSGNLLAQDPGAGATYGISLNAPNGTIFITGIVQTTNTDPTADGDAAGRG